jgi:hypothetical protein
MKRIAVAARWAKTWADTVGTWWGIMSGAFSIPFAFLMFFFSQRWLFATLAYLSLWVLVISQGRRISELQKRLELPNVKLHVGRDLIDGADDFDGPFPATWVRGRITNTGDRGIEGCRVKLLKVEGQNLRVENGFLQWQGGVRESMRLDPGEHGIFDIGTRSYKIPGIPLRLCAHFVTGPQAPLISCRLEAPWKLHDNSRYLWRQHSVERTKLWHHNR